MTQHPDDAEIRQTLKQHADYYEAPNNLHQNILQLINDSQTQTQTSITPLWWDRFSTWISFIPLPMATAFFVGAFTATLLSVTLMESKQQAHTLTLALVADHARALVMQSTLEVPSTNMHTVKPWLSSTLGYSPTIVDLADVGFPLIGGRRGFVGGEAIAVAVYRHNQHIIDVYTLKNTERSIGRVSNSEGFNIRSWKTDGMTYIAISDVDTAKLTSFSLALSSRQNRSQN